MTVLEALLEGFAPSEHPRDFRGRWRKGDKVHTHNVTNGVRHPVNGVVQKGLESYDATTSRGTERSHTVTVKWSDGDVSHERPGDVNAGHLPGGDKPPAVKPIQVKIPDEAYARRRAELARQNEATHKRRRKAGLPDARPSTLYPGLGESVLGVVLEGFAAPAPGDPFPDNEFTAGDNVRVAVGGGASSVVGKVVRPHGAPKPTHAVIAPDGGGAHVLAPVGQVKLNTPAQHAAAAKRAERQEAKRAEDEATAAWMASKPPAAKVPGAPAVKKPGKPVREGVALVLEAFAPPETPAQSQTRGAAQVAAANKSLAAGWNASKHPRSQGGKFGYTTGGKRATRSTGATSRTLGVGSKGALVTSIQRQLHVAQDGQYGPNTKAAIEQLQRQHGLQVDGVVGAQTIAALRGNPNARKITPGPITSRTARVHPATRKPRAPVRIGGGIVV